MKNKPEEKIIGSTIDASAAPAPQTPAGVLVVKLQELGDIAGEIEIHARKLSKREKAEVDRLETEMQEKLQEHLLGARIVEADIKLDTMRQVRDLVKKQ